MKTQNSSNDIVSLFAEKELKSYLSRMGCPDLNYKLNVTNLSIYGLKKVFDNMNLSARSYDKVLKVARTIADLDGQEIINEIHILEAVQYRDMDREV